MKKLLLAICLLFTFISYSQKQYTVDGEGYSLKTDVKGELTLLWNVIDDEYRYFSQKGTDIVELKNTEIDGNYQEEYKTVLANQTADANLPTENVKLTLSGLRKFFNDYNVTADPNFVAEKETVQIGLRLGAFAGISNNIYFLNPDNTTLPAAGVEFEVFDQVVLPRHSVVIRFTQLIGNDDYDFSSSEFSLNYRFKFVQTEAFNLFANLKIASYSYISQDFDYLDDSGNPANRNGTGGAFDAPASFGIGADFKLGNGYLFLTYNDFVSIANDNVNEEFPMDVSLGYKFNL